MFCRRVIFCTGLGAVTPAVLDGAPAPSSPAQTTATAVVTIGGVSANVLFSGLTPGLVGLYQVNVLVPAGISTGIASLSISVHGAASQPVQIATR
jgi:adhesin/invasin